MNKRQQEISNFINININNNNINNLLSIYNDELNGYTYIDNIYDFSLLRLKGSIRYINQYDEKLRYGGLLIKIYNKKNTNEWICVLKKSNGKKYYVNYKNNYIFYLESKNNNFRNWAELFISDINKGKYEIN
jgi:hypothetical protein